MKIRDSMGPDPHPIEERTRGELEKAARAFESILVKQMLHAMVSSSTEGGFFGDSNGGDTWEDLFESGMSDALSKNGDLGIAKQIVRQLGTVAERRVGGSAASGGPLGPGDPDPDSRIHAPLAQSVTTPAAGGSSGSLETPRPQPMEGRRDEDRSGSRIDPRSTGTPVRTDPSPAAPVP